MSDMVSSSQKPIQRAASEWKANARSDEVDPPILASVIARLDPKSGLPDFGTKLSKSETSDFDAIQYPTAGGYWIARSSRAMTART